MQKTPKISASRTFFLITEHFNLQFQSLNMYWYKKNLNQCNEQHVKYIYIYQSKSLMFRCIYECLMIYTGKVKMSIEK